MPKQDLECRSIAVDQISVDYDNPNSMEPGEFERLKSSIRTLGFLQPCVVAKSEQSDVAMSEPYTMVDGWHRRRAMIELGATHIPCVVADDMTAAKTIAGRMAMNANRGTVDLTVAAMQLEGLIGRNDFAIDDLGFTGFSEDELKSMLEAVSSEEPDIMATDITMPAPSSTPAGSFSLEIKFLSKEQRDSVRRALKEAGSGDLAIGAINLTNTHYEE